MYHTTCSYMYMYDYCIHVVCTCSSEDLRVHVHVRVHWICCFTNVHCTCIQSWKVTQMWERIHVHVHVHVYVELIQNIIFAESPRWVMSIAYMYMKCTYKCTCTCICHVWVTFINRKGTVRHQTSMLVLDPLLKLMHIPHKYTCTCSCLCYCLPSLQPSESSSGPEVLSDGS